MRPVTGSRFRLWSPETTAAKCGWTYIIRWWTPTQRRHTCGRLQRPVSSNSVLSTPSLYATIYPVPTMGSKSEQVAYDRAQHLSLCGAHPLGHDPDHFQFLI